MINDMKTKEFISTFEILYPEDQNLDVGERDFFEFMKRANRDLTSEQRFKILNLTINTIKKGEFNG
jgi:hypothetical protein